MEKIRPLSVPRHMAALRRRHYAVAPGDCSSTSTAPSVHGRVEETALCLSGAAEDRDLGAERETRRYAMIVESGGAML